MSCKASSFGTEYIMVFSLGASAVGDNLCKFVREVPFQVGEHPNWFDADMHEYYNATT